MTYTEMVSHKIQLEIERLETALNRLIEDIDGKQELNAELDVAINKRF